MDAAVLLEAEWTVVVNEVWIASIPQKEVMMTSLSFGFDGNSLFFSLQAIRRIVERDHLTPDEAKRRLSSQMTNQQRFPHAHVLLCTYWAESVTQQQVERAWNLLMQRIPPNPIVID